MTEKSPENSGIAVMYHYVRPERSAIPAGIRPLLASEFEKQLDWLAERYDILPAKEFLDRVFGGTDPSPVPGPIQYAAGARAAKLALVKKPPCLLTFDDGTKDHAEVITPILARRGLSGVFFVLSWPAELEKMPLTHAVHWLLSGDEQAVWQSFERHARDHLGGLTALGDPTEAARIYHYESPLRARIKYAANMALPSEATEAVVEAAVRAAGRKMPDLAAEWFVSAADIRRMHSAGMTIASHGCSHRSLQMLGPAGIRQEIHHASDYIQTLIGRRPQWYACPFGGAGVPAETIAAMHAAMTEAGIIASVSTEKRYIRAQCNPLTIPRLDAVDLPPRRAEPLAA